MTTSYISSIQASIYKLDAMLLQASKAATVQQVLINNIKDMLEEKEAELEAAIWMEDNK